MLPPPPPYPPPDTDVAEPLGSPGEGAAPEATDPRPTRTCPVPVPLPRPPLWCLVSLPPHLPLLLVSVPPHSLPSAPGGASRQRGPCTRPESGLTHWPLRLWLGFGRRGAVWGGTVRSELVLLELEPTSDCQPSQPQRRQHSPAAGSALAEGRGPCQRSEGQGISTRPPASVLALCGKGDRGTGRRRRGVGSSRTERRLRGRLPRPCLRGRALLGPGSSRAMLSAAWSSRRQGSCHAGPASTASQSLPRRPEELPHLQA